MTDIDPTIQAIRDREKAATEGPWTLRDGWGPAKDGTMRFARIATPDHADVLTSKGRYGDLAATQANAEFIAGARTDVPYLLAEVDRMRGEWDRLVNERADLLGRIHSLDEQLTAANRRADGLQADLNSAAKANTAYANENARLRRQIAELKPVVEAIDSLLATTDGDPLGDLGIAIPLRVIRQVRDGQVRRACDKPGYHPETCPTVPAENVEVTR